MTRRRLCVRVSAGVTALAALLGPHPGAGHQPPVTGSAASAAVLVAQPPPPPYDASRLRFGALEWGEPIAVSRTKLRAAGFRVTQSTPTLAHADGTWLGQRAQLTLRTDTGVLEQLSACVGVGAHTRPAQVTPLLRRVVAVMTARHGRAAPHPDTQPGDDFYPTRSAHFWPPGADHTYGGPYLSVDYAFNARCGVSVEYGARFITRAPR